MKKSIILMGLMLAALPVLANEAYDFEYEAPVCTPLAGTCSVVRHFQNTSGQNISYPCYVGQKTAVENRSASNLHLTFNVCVNDKIVTIRPGELLKFIGVQRGNKLVWQQIDKHTQSNHN